MFGCALLVLGATLPLGWVDPLTGAGSESAVPRHAGALHRVVLAAAPLPSCLSDPTAGSELGAARPTFVGVARRPEGKPNSDEGSPAWNDVFQWWDDVSGWHQPASSN